MKVHKNICFDAKKSIGTPTVITIGNFDGCHLGHQKLIEATISEAKRLNRQSAVLTFDPSPESFFQGQRSPRIFSLEQKCDALAALGIKHCVIESFDKKFSQLTHQEFFEKFLIERLNLDTLIVGYDFRFGAERLGDINFLKESCASKNITIIECDAKEYDIGPISSSRIRQALSRGNIGPANEMLGHPFSLTGTICQGQRLGRKIGFPTINVDNISQLTPLRGVYFGYVELLNENPRPLSMNRPSSALPAVINIGTRPTVNADGSGRWHVEAHVISTFDDQGEQYGSPVAIYFAERLRSEMEFENIEALKKAIALDIEKAKELLSQSRQ